MHFEREDNGCAPAHMILSMEQLNNTKFQIINSPYKASTYPAFIDNIPGVFCTQSLIRDKTIAPDLSYFYVFKSIFLAPNLHKRFGLINIYSIFNILIYEYLNT